MMLHAESQGLGSGRQEINRSEAWKTAGNQRTNARSQRRKREIHGASVMKLNILQSLSPHQHGKQVGQITHLNLLELGEELVMKFDEVGEVKSEARRKRKCTPSGKVRCVAASEADPSFTMQEFDQSK